MAIRDWFRAGRAPRCQEKELARALGASTARALQYPLSGADSLARGQGYQIYDAMQADAQVRASLNVKKLGVLAAQWELVPDNDSQEACDIAEFIRFNFSYMTGSVISLLWKAMDCFAKGFSVLEQIYELREEQPYQGKFVLKAVKAKDPQLFGFDVDEFLNIKGLNLIVPGEVPTEMPRDKFILYSYNSRYESPWGESDLRSAHQHWFAKTALLKFWSVYLEKYGSPTVMGIYKRGLPPESQDELLEVLEKLQRENALVIPEDVQVQLLQSLQNGGQGYLEAVDYHNKEIARAILGQTLATDEGRRVGSLALGTVHLQVLLLQLQSLRRDLAETVVTEQVIRPLVVMNFGEMAYPHFRFVEQKSKWLEDTAAK